MNPATKKTTIPKRKPRTPKKSQKNALPAKHKKPPKKKLSKKKAPDKVRNHLRNKVLKQADELKLKNGQIREREDKERLAEEQVYIRTKAMDATSDGIFIIDAQKRGFPVIYSNQSFEAMIGFSKKDILGKDYFSLYGTAADARITEEIKKTLRKDKSFHGEMLNFRKNGEKFWNYLRITPIRDTQGVVSHFIGIQTDMTLMRQKDLEIKEQREELLHVTRVGKLAEFVSSLAHEISQPLTAILSYAQAAQRIYEGREPELQEILQYIINDDQRASEVIRRLRSLLKKSEPESKRLNVNVLIDQTVALLSTDITVRNKVIRTELDPELPPIRGDQIQLQQVLLNLISNSLDAMEKRDQSRELVIRTSCKNSDVIAVEVEDSGCGIPAGNIEKLFKHFFTSKPDGLGMGLSISRSIIESHGGRLDGRNNTGRRGATFSFTLPGTASRKKNRKKRT